MKRRIWISVVFSFLLALTMLTAASTTSTILTYKANEVVDLKVPCINNGTYCSAVAVCNITLVYPNGSLFIKNQQMTNQISYHNYTLPSSDIEGTYTGSVSCIDGSDKGTNPSVTFIINSTGNGTNFSFFIIIGLITLLIFIIALYSGNEYIMFISSSLTLITGIYGMVYGIGNVNDIFSRSVSMVIIGLGIIFLIISSLKAIAEVTEETGIGGYGAGGDDYDYFRD